MMFRALEEIFSPGRDWGPAERVLGDLKERVPRAKLAMVHFQLAREGP